MMDPSKPRKAPLKSTLADDPEMAELVMEFVADLAKRRDAIQVAMETQRVDELRRLAHQLRGASASYGLRPIGEAAAKVEDAIKAMGTAPVSELERIRADVDDLLEVCERAARA
ncbi:MAG: Hpt domain-containing protein [Phycisphaerales bacterium]|jgi:HPt (histidine-containing phosphotransfer) domain-containing protein